MSAPVCHATCVGLTYTQPCYCGCFLPAIVDHLTMVAPQVISGRIQHQLTICALAQLTSILVPIIHHTLLSSASEGNWSCVCWRYLLICRLCHNYRGRGPMVPAGLCNHKCMSVHVHVHVHVVHVRMYVHVH